MTDPVYLATSTTSLTVGTGPQKFVTQTGLAYVTGDRVRATSAGTGEWMEGLVSGYSADSLTMTSDLTNGTGTHADWEITLVLSAKDAAAAKKDEGPVALLTPSETKVGVQPTGNSSVQIPRKGVLTVAVITTKGTPMGSQWRSVTLPKDAAVMDVVEVHCSPDSAGLSVQVFPNKGEAIGSNEASNGDNPSNVSASVGGGGGVSFRKVSPSLWLIS